MVHEIHLKPGVTPYYSPGTRRFAPAELDAIFENLQEELRTGKIVEFEGPWCAPNIEELLERMAGFRWYSSCDGFTGYYAVRVRLARNVQGVREVDR